MICVGLIGLGLGPAWGASLLPPGKNCFTDANGVSLAGGSISFYVPSTLTPRLTWIDASQVTPNASPTIALGASDGCAVIYGVGIYREILKDSIGNTIWDQVVASPASSGVSWGATSTGSANAQVVTASEFNVLDGQVVAFKAGFTNSAGVTLQTQNQAAITITKDTTAGPTNLTGGEIVIGNVVELIYSSSENKFHILNLLPPSSPAVDFQSFTVAGAATWTKPVVGSGAVSHLECWGAGGGGAANATAGGGGGGTYSDRWITSSSLGATETVTITAGGAIGTAGGNSTFGAWLTAYGGGAGFNGAAGGGGGGGGESSKGTNAPSSTGGAGGGPWTVAAGSPSPSGGGGGTGAAAGAAGGAGYFGGGAGGGGSSGANAGGAGGGSVWGGGGGGGTGNSNGAAGTSQWGGAGGAGGSAGSQPGGGGGRNATGGAGQCQATTYP